MFTGFTSDATTFFEGLKADNTRDYFAAHKNEYTRAVRQPMEDLLGEVQEKYGPGKITRANRDVRFSVDKTPYRTYVSMWAGNVGGVYLTLCAHHMQAGGGLFDASRDQLERSRTAIDAVPLAGDELAKILSELESSGFEAAMPALKTAPKGYDRDHPRTELLRLKQYALTRGLPVDASAEDIWATWTKVEPLIAWGERYVGPALSWP